MRLCGLLCLNGLILCAQASIACDPAMEADRTVNAPHDKPARILIPDFAAGVVVEETGTDLEYRLAGTSEYQEIPLRPPRLGAVGLRKGAGPLDIRSKRHQAPGGARIRFLCDDSGGELEFMERLATAFREVVDDGQGADVLRTLDAWMDEETNPPRRAWLHQLRSNALESIGRNLDAASAYLAARDAWRAAGDPARAAVDLMAAAEGLSRAGELAQAAQMFDSVLLELERHGLNYYRLRTKSAKCLVRSRMGDVAGALECDIPVVAEMRQAGELSEASTREVSIANQWLKLGNTDNAQAALLRADRNSDALSKYGIARLSSAFGNYYLQIGDVTSAAREYALASKRFEVASLPGDQANIDLKLSRLAHFAGAYTEELRLIDRALAHLHTESAREQVGDAMLRASDANRALGNDSGAQEDLVEAERLCVALKRNDCLDSIQLRRARSAIDTGRFNDARNLIETRRQNGAEWSTLSSWLDLVGSRLPESDLAGAFGNSIDAISVGHPDLKVELTLASAKILRDRSVDEDARRLLALQLDRMADEIASWPSIALRIGARARLSRLQQQWFDLLPGKSGQDLPGALVDQLWAVIEANGAQRVLWAKGTGNPLSQEERSRLSASVAVGSELDQRALLLALSDVKRGGDDGSAAPSPRRVNQAFPEGKLVLLPLLGESRFTLIASDGKRSRICVTHPAADYRALVARFDSALNGGAESIAELDLIARTWFEAVSRCLSTTKPTAGWRVVSTPASASLPWNWIAAAADGSGVEEPSVSKVFARPASSDPAVSSFSRASILDFDLGGDDALPASAGERKLVHDLLTQGRTSATVEVLAGPTRIHRILDRLSTRDNLVHVIGHSNSIEAGQLYSGIWFPSEAGPALATMPELAANRSQASLVVLSACGTGVLGQSGALAAVGLGEALVASGVSAVVAASNPASDPASVRWVGEFYRQLIRSGNAEESLKLARRHLRSLPPYRHPKYWAAIDMMKRS